MGPKDKFLAQKARRDAKLVDQNLRQQLKLWPKKPRRELKR